MFLLLASRLPGSTTRTKCVGELRDREDAFAVEPVAILFRYAGQQTEFILFSRLHVAPSFELATGRNVGSAQGPAANYRPGVQ